MNHSTRTAQLQTKNQVPLFTFLCAASIVAWWHPLAATLGLAFANEAYTHILLILPVSAGLIYLNLKRPHSTEASGTSLFRLLVGAVALLALVIGAYAKWGMASSSPDVRVSLGMFALVTWWIASAGVCFGAKIFHSFLFPLCFLFLMVPIPEFALNWIVEFLQQQSAIAARILFRLAGVPVTQDGIMLSIPGLDIEVARECSSIRSSLMLVITTMVLANLLLRSWWRQALLIAAAVPLSVAKNGLRIFVISALGTRVDPAFLDGALHHHGGIVFLGIALAVVVLMLWMLQRTETQIPAPPA